MSVCHESRRVSLYHANMETLARVHTFDHNTSRERALDTACTVPDRLASLHRLRVRKRDSGRPTGTTRGFVDMRRRGRGRIEFALEVVQGDVVTDHVGSAVDAEVECARCAGETASRLRTVDDFFWNSVNEVGGRKGEELLSVDDIGGYSPFVAHVDVELQLDAAVADVERGCRQWRSDCAEHQACDGGKSGGIHYGIIFVQEARVLKGVR
jgi:hypothetical protein